MTTTPAIRLKLSKKQGSWYPQSQFSAWDGEKRRNATRKKLTIITLVDPARSNVLIAPSCHAYRPWPAVATVANTLDHRINQRNDSELFPCGVSPLLTIPS